MIQWGFVFFDSSSQQSVCSFFSGVSYIGFYFKAPYLKEKIITNYCNLLCTGFITLFFTRTYSFICFAHRTKKKLVLEKANYVGLCQQGNLGARVSLITKFLGSN